MYQFQHGNPGFVPQQGQPSAPHGMVNNQPRRPLAINEMLNEVPPRQFPRDESYLLQPRYPYMPQPPPPIQTPYAQPQDPYHPYSPATMYRNSPYMTAGHRVELPPPPPPEVMERRTEAGYNDYYMSHPRG